MRLYLFVFLIYLVMFDFVLFIMIGKDGFSNFGLGLYNMFFSAMGDIPYNSIEESHWAFGPLLGIGVAFFLLLVYLNLLIAVMSEAIEEVKAEARARWAVQQFKMLENRRVRNYHDPETQRSIRRQGLLMCCCCCCYGEPEEGGGSGRPGRGGGDGGGGDRRGSSTRRVGGKGGRRPSKNSIHPLPKRFSSEESLFSPSEMGDGDGSQFSLVDGSKE